MSNGNHNNVIGSNQNLSKYTMDKGLNGISGGNDKNTMKNFFTTPGISNESRKMNTEDIFTQNKNKQNQIF